MSALRTLSLVLAFAAAVGLVFGTAGFTAMSADRGLAVNVTDDESAYLGYEPVNDTVRDGQPTEIVEYRNQFDSDLDEFDVDVSSPRDDVTVVSTPEALGEGDKRRVELTIRCDTEATVPLEFDADGRGDDLSVSLDRTHTVTCVPTAPTVTGVEFNDGANANVTVQSADGSVAANVWLAPNPPENRADDLTKVAFDGNRRLQTAERVRPQINRNATASSVTGNRKIAAIEFPAQNVTYVHPAWNEGEYDPPKTGAGVAYDGPVDEDFLLNASVENGEVVVAEDD